LQSLLIIAGEVSGDLHGSKLISALRKRNKSVEFIGVGGDRMIQSGLKAIYHIRDFSFLGFTEVLSHIPFIRRVKQKLISIVKKEKIQLAVLIDYPGFNLSLAKSLKKLNVKIVYYISPQIWAWGKYRIHKLERLIDKMLLVLPFEKEFYKNANLDFEYVGHPLIERINEYQFLSRDDFYKKFNLQLNKDILLLMPGSRKHEVELILPAILPASIKLSQKYDLQIVIALNENIEKGLFEKFIGKDVKLISSNIYDLIKHSKFGLIKSGTSTLETALIGLPFIVVYKISNLSYLIGRLLISIKNIAIPNIILGKSVVPELIQKDLNTDNVFQTIDSYLFDLNKSQEMATQLNKIKNLLGDKNASEESAKIISEMLNE